MPRTRELPLPNMEDIEAYEDFISSYEGIVKRIVSDSIREIGDFTLNFDDLYQEGMIALFHATKKYRDTGNASFMTYAYKAVKNRVIKEAKKYNKIYSYEGRSYDLDPEKYEKMFSTNEELDYYPMVEQFLNKLNRDDQMVFKLYLQGRSYAEIAAIMNKNIKQIDNRLCLIKKKLSGFCK